MGDEEENIFERVERIKQENSHYKSGEGTGANTNKDLGRTTIHWVTGNSDIGDQTYPGFSRFFMRLSEIKQLKDNPEKYILTGFVPEKPFIEKTNNITALGSCFAEEIVKYLSSNYALT